MKAPHLSAAQADVLYWLDEMGGTFTPEHPRYFTRNLSEELGHSQSSIGNSLRRLEEMGLIETRRSNEEGGYIHQVKQTMKGEQAAESPYLGLTSEETVMAWLAHNQGVCLPVTNPETGLNIRPSGRIGGDPFVPLNNTTISTAIRRLYENGKVVARVTEHDDRTIYEAIALEGTLLNQQPDPPEPRQTTVDEHIAEAEAANGKQAPEAVGATPEAIAAKLLDIVIERATTELAPSFEDEYRKARRDVKRLEDELELARKALYEERRRNEALQEELLEHGARNKVDYDESTLEKLKKLMTQTGAGR